MNNKKLEEMARESAARNAAREKAQRQKEEQAKSKHKQDLSEAQQSKVDAFMAKLPDLIAKAKQQKQDHVTYVADDNEVTFTKKGWAVFGATKMIFDQCTDAGLKVEIGVDSGSDCSYNSWCTYFLTIKW